MNKFKNYFLGFLIIFLTLFGIIVLNQIVSIYNNLSTINPYLGIFVAGLCVLLLVILIFMQIYAIIRFPKVKTLPENPTQEEVKIYKELYLNRLKKNRVLRRLNYQFEGETLDEQIENATSRLKAVAMERVKDDANSVFLTTAVSQNGVLDGLSVLFTLGVMIYKVIEIYENRPGFRRLLYLYSQIASVVLVAGSIEDMNLIEDQLEPILTTLLGSSILSAIPGAVGITTLVTNSLVEGSVNALLTLRVGIVCQRYLSSPVDLDKKTLRKGAFYEATGHLGSIIANNGMLVVKSITTATKKATIDKIPNPFSTSSFFRKKEYEEI